MGRFLTTPTIYPFKALDTGRWTWAIAEPLVWEVGPIGSEWFITAEAGFYSDLGSIPAWLRWMFNPADPACARPYLLHDKINAMIVIPRWIDGHTSQFAASQLYEALAFEGVPMLSRVAQFAGVVVGIAKAEW